MQLSSDSTKTRSDAYRSNSSTGVGRSTAPPRRPTRLGHGAGFGAVASTYPIVDSEIAARPVAWCTARAGGRGQGSGEG